MLFSATCKAVVQRSASRDFARLLPPSISSISHSLITPNYAGNILLSLNQTQSRPYSIKTRSIVNDEFKETSSISSSVIKTHKQCTFSRNNVNSFSNHVIRCYSSKDTPSSPAEELTYVEDPFINEYEDPKINSPLPLRVVIIGWMGCKKRYVEKYARLWANSGDHEIIVLQPSIYETLMPYAGIVAGGKGLDKIAKLHRLAPDMPTVYHIFSTGGFIMAGTIWKWLDEIDDVGIRRFLTEEVQGIIFDSGPAQPRAPMAARAIVSSFTKVPAEFVDEKYGGLVARVESFLEWWLKRDSVVQREKDVLEAWYHQSPYCPHLYLYGDKDLLCTPEDVEGYRAIQAMRGIRTRSHKFVGGTHVDLFRRSPFEYTHVISQFLAQVIKTHVSFDGQDRMEDDELPTKSHLLK